MRTNEDRNWEMIEAALAAESSGKSPRLFSSRRTLFGIPSALDQEMAKLDAQAAQAAEGTGRPEHSECPDRLERPERRKAAPRHVTHPLDPVFNERSRVLILGTMPSPKSRETGFYYNHPQNRFWRVIATLLDKPVPASNDEKKALVLAHGIALWDVLAECTIEGASDGTIAECVPNDIAWLLGQAPIEAIFCTGAKATELYQKYCEPATGRACTRLPSTSPANASVSLAQLIEAYRQILPFCG